MKQIRLIFWLLVLGFIGLLVYQNRDYFLAKHSLGIDLWFGKYTIPETPNGLYFLGSFLIGLLLAYFYQLLERFRSAKTIKTLNATISSLKAEAAARTRGAARATPAARTLDVPAADDGSAGEAAQAAAPADSGASATEGGTTPGDG